MIVCKSACLQACCPNSENARGTAQCPSVEIPPAPDRRGGRQCNNVGSTQGTGAIRGNEAALSKCAAQELSAAGEARPIAGERKGQDGRRARVHDPLFVPLKPNAPVRRRVRRPSRRYLDPWRASLHSGKKQIPGFEAVVHRNSRQRITGNRDRFYREPGQAAPGFGTAFTGRRDRNGRRNSAKPLTNSRGNF